MQGGAHALFRLTHRLIGQPHNLKGWQTARELNLNNNILRLNPLKRDCMHLNNHKDACTPTHSRMQAFFKDSQWHSSIVKR